MDFDWRLLAEHFIKLGAATLAGGAIGLDRELGRHWAGMRTHMLVALGSATFALLGGHLANGHPNASARVVQGIAAGIGFLGAGTILKLDHRQQIKGLTTASSIWLSAAIGAVAGLGQFELLAVSLAISIAVLALLRPVSRSIGVGHHDPQDPPAEQDPPVDLK